MFPLKANFIFLRDSASVLLCVEKKSFLLHVLFFFVRVCWVLFFYFCDCSHFTDERPDLTFAPVALFSKPLHTQFICPNIQTARYCHHHCYRPSGCYHRKQLSPLFGLFEQSHCIPSIPSLYQSYKCRNFSFCRISFYHAPTLISPNLHYHTPVISNHYHQLSQRIWLSFHSIYYRISSIDSRYHHCTFCTFDCAVRTSATTPVFAAPHPSSIHTHITKSWLQHSTSQSTSLYSIVPT